MKQILIVTPDSISKQDKILLKKEGVIVIEHANPSIVRIITPLDGLQSDELINSIANAGLTASSSFVREEAGKAVLRQLSRTK